MYVLSENVLCDVDLLIFECYIYELCTVLLLSSNVQGTFIKNFTVTSACVYVIA